MVVEVVGAGGGRRRTRIRTRRSRGLLRLLLRFKRRAVKPPVRTALEKGRRLKRLLPLPRARRIGIELLMALREARSAAVGGEAGADAAAATGRTRLLRRRLELAPRRAVVERKGRLLVPVMPGLVLVLHLDRVRQPAK